MDIKRKIVSILLCVTIIIPLFFYKPTKIYAENNISLDNSEFAKWFMTATGLGKVENGSLTGISPDVFYGLLYNTPLTITDYPGAASGQYTFVPSEVFNSKNEWIQVCNHTWDPSGPHATYWNTFDLSDCFINSGFTEDNGDGVAIKEVPALSDTTDLAAPLDGVEVLTNFGSYSPDFSNEQYPYLTKQLVDDTADTFDNYILLSGKSAQNNTAAIMSDSFLFYAYDNSTNYVFLVRSSPQTNNPNNRSTFNLLARYNNAFKIAGTYSTAITSGYNGKVIYHNNTSLKAPFVSGTVTMTDSNVTQNSYYIYITLEDYQIYSNQPVVIASTQTAGENYYYWKNQIPSGILYTSNNINQTYNYNTLNYTNWNSTYNNYISDISNIYSTTENITNQQITQYIDDSTTITNITNNYIVNGSGSGEGGSGEGGSGEGGSGSDDILTNSWLERIYNKNVQILKAILGDTYDPDQDITYYTDNSIKNEIIRYPVSDLFPDVPIDKFMDTASDFTVDAFASALSGVITQAIPFCYIVALYEVANVMRAEPQAPKWNIPFKITRIGIDEVVTIDLTSDAWNVVHNIWIGLVMILLISLLFYLSYKILHLAAVIFG